VQAVNVNWDGVGAKLARLEFYSILGRISSLDTIAIIVESEKLAKCFRKVWDKCP
jgi:hypothetical protein